MCGGLVKVGTGESAKLELQGLRVCFAAWPHTDYIIVCQAPGKSGGVIKVWGDGQKTGGFICDSRCSLKRRLRRYK